MVGDELGSEFMTRSYDGSTAHSGRPGHDVLELWEMVLRYYGASRDVVLGITSVRPKNPANPPLSRCATRRECYQISRNYTVYSSEES